MPGEQQPFHVLVLGDVSIDRRAVRLSPAGSESVSQGLQASQQHGLRTYDMPGGAWFLAACIRTALCPRTSVGFQIQNDGFLSATIENLKLRKARVRLRGGTVCFGDEKHTPEEIIVYIGKEPREGEEKDRLVFQFDKFPSIPFAWTDRTASKNQRGKLTGMACASLELMDHRLLRGKGVTGTITDPFFRAAIAMKTRLPKRIGRDMQKQALPEGKLFSVQDSVVVEAEVEDGDFDRAVFEGITQVTAKIQAAEEQERPTTEPRILTYEYSRNNLPAGIVRSWAELDLFPADSDGEQRTVYRIKELRGFDWPDERLSILNGEERRNAVAGLVADICAFAPTILVIEDQGNGYRDDDACLRDLKRVLPLCSVVIYKASRTLPPPDGGFWKLLQSCADRVIAVISADALREVGVKLSGGLSWEKTAEDFLNEIKAGSSRLSQLASLGRMVVRLCISGAIYFGPTTDRRRECRLFFDPGEVETSYRGESTFGVLTGYNSVIVASIVRELYQDRQDRNRPDVIEPKFGEPILPEATHASDRLAATRTAEAGGAPDELSHPLLTGVKRGIASCRRYFRSGFGTSLDDLHHLQFPLLPDDHIFDQDGKEIGEFRLPSLEEYSPTNSLNIFQSAFGGKSADALYAFAEFIVMRGLKLALERANPKFPIARFGQKLNVVDREEIEGFRAISSLIQNYANTRNPPRPLCIAVFGAPGAGKSFGVRAVAENILGRDRVRFLECNLAQFTSSDDLADVFALVRDSTLEPSVSLPILLLDEFDAPGPNGDELGWLKYLLAPMQDGRYKSKQSMLGIGKALLIFAGGTTETYEEFCPPADGSKQPDKCAARLEVLKRTKGTDFVSRLRGHANISSINGSMHRQEREDPLSRGREEFTPDLFLIRRAILFRSLLEKLASSLVGEKRDAAIDQGVIRAFLQVKEYRHGARSMEAVLEMSALAGRRRFPKSAIPKKELLDMHVTADDFLGHLAVPDKGPWHPAASEGFLAGIPG